MAETQPLLPKVVAQNSPSTTTISMTPQAAVMPSPFKPPPSKKPKWNSYKHPEVRHELILYGELAVGAALVVALYLVALLPFEYIQRTQLIAARLQPHPLDATTMDKFLELKRQSQEQLDDEDNKIRFRLTKRPCGWKILPHASHSIPDRAPEKPNQKKGYLTTPENADTVPFIPYQDIFQLAAFNCYSNETDNRCPCGFKHYWAEKKLCYSFEETTSKISYIQYLTQGKMAKFGITEEVLSKLDSTMIMCGPPGNSSAVKNSSEPSTDHSCELGDLPTDAVVFHQQHGLHSHVFLYTAELFRGSWWKVHV